MSETTRRSEGLMHPLRVVFPPPRSLFRRSVEASDFIHSSQNRGGAFYVQKTVTSPQQVTLLGIKTKLEAVLKQSFYVSHVSLSHLMPETRTKYQTPTETQQNAGWTS